MLEALFAQTPIGLGMVDCELRFVRVNDALARMDGLAPEDHPGHTMVELFGELGAPTQALLQRVLEAGEPLVDEEISGPVPWNGGEIRHYRATYTRIHDESGRALGVTALVADVTDRRRDELERERSLERERRKLPPRSSAARRSPAIPRASRRAATLRWPTWRLPLTPANMAAPPTAPLGFSG